MAPGVAVRRLRLYNSSSVTTMNLSIGHHCQRRSKIQRVSPGCAFALGATHFKKHTISSAGGVPELKIPNLLESSQ